jgi:hypothetical protein
MPGLGLGLGLNCRAVGGGVGANGGLDMDFAAGRYALSGAYSSSFPAGWAFTRASPGLAQRLDGSWASFAAGVPRITNRGLLVEEQRINDFLNSDAPATQDIVLGVGTHTLTVWGSAGSVTTSAGTAVGAGFGVCAASVAGTSQTFTVSSGGTVTFTVAGAPLYVNVEASYAYGTSPIITAGAPATRSPDAPSVSSLSALMAFPCTFIAAAELFLLDGLFNRVLTELSAGAVSTNRVNVQRNSANAATVAAISGGVTQAAALSVPGMTGARVLSMGARLQEATYNAVSDGVMGAETAWTPPAGLSKISFGTTGTAGGILRGYVRRARLFPRALSDAEMQALTS